MFRSVLIANRGEIAVRIARTARTMGMRVVAVHSETDAGAMHVRMADESHLLGGAAAADSYLRAGRILNIAKETGAEAIHPGYGFLSENADFAGMVAEAGMVFVGPPPDAIRAMGSKDRAKAIMADAGVPVVPGYHGDNQDPEFLKRKAYEIGYPVLVKAVSGGGGKGMRKVARALDFDAALDAAKREAAASFGDDRVLIERFVSAPRHIEMQVFADTHGNVVHLGERDCSMQRRHQKVLEEAPAPDMTPELRAVMGDAACEAARAVGYEGAGTVEFIVDASDGLREDGFFFMEMNTRLQVEHPVTEMVTGTDLVEWQFRVAAGEALPLTQDEISLDGHAIEARIYAEDPAAGFLPSVGRLAALKLPTGREGVRVDSGVEAGDAVSEHYDPMIAKLIVHAADRASALDRMASALRYCTVAGPRSNLAFLHALVRDDDFAAGEFDTSLIDGKLEELTESHAPDAGMDAAAAGVLLESKAPPLTGPWGAVDAFQLIGDRTRGVVLERDGEAVALRIRETAGTIEVLDDEWTEAAPDTRLVHDGERVLVLRDGTQHEYRLAPVGKAADAAGQAGAVRVPMHGKIVGVSVQEGDDVERGDMLFSVEAMKMEHAVLAPADGTVTALTVAAAQQVEANAVALVIVATSEPDA